MKRATSEKQFTKLTEENDGITNMVKKPYANDHIVTTFS